MPSLSARQRTLAESVVFTGLGVHSGRPSKLTITPAPPESGIMVSRVSFNGHVLVGPTRLAPGLVTSTTLCTTLEFGGGARISTIEHVLAALSGLGVDNALITVDAEECPIMDGSAVVFGEAILEAGLVVQPAQRSYIRVLRPVVVQRNGSFAIFEPFNGRSLDVEIDFDCPVIGQQRMVHEWSPRRFLEDIAPARTFGFWSDAERLRQAGFAKGSSLGNSVLIDDNLVLNPDGLRYRDEFVRHKLLDAIGDLALAGLPIYGRFRSYKGGHALNALALAELFASAGNFAVVPAGALPAGLDQAEDVLESLNATGYLRSVG